MNRPSGPKGLASVLVTLRTTSSGAPRGRRLIGLLLLAWMPVLVQLASLLFETGRGQGFSVFAEKVSHIYLSLILPLTTVFLGTAAFGDEWAGGTAHYVVGLPVSRASLVLGRWLAATRRVLLFVLPPLVVTYALSVIGFADAFTHYLIDFGVVLAVVVLLTLAYSAIFLFFGLYLRRAVMVSFVYVFVLEMLTARLPQAFASFSIRFHGRNILFDLTGHEGFRLFTMDMQSVEPLSAGWSVIWVVGVGAAALGLSTLALHRKESGGEAAAADAAST